MPLRKPYKILIVTPTFGKYGGIEAMVLNLAKTIKKDPSFSVTVCFKRVKGFSVTPSLSNIYEEAQIPYITVRRADKNLFKAIKEADLIHAQNVPPDVIFFSKILRKPILLHIHHWCRRHLSLHTILWRLCVKWANYRTYVSQFVWNTWEPQKKRKNSSCMPSVPELTDVPVNFERRKGFIFVSRWIKNKGLRTLLKAYQEADIDKDRWPLTLIGEGPLRAWVAEFLSNNALPSVQCLGFLDQQAKAKKIAASKWLVAPPNTREDLGMTPIEARFLSVPSIITRDGGLPEAAGPSALVCEPGNVQALRETLEKATTITEEDYQKRCLEAKATLDHFIKSPLEYLKVYTSILNVPPST